MGPFDPLQLIFNIINQLMKKGLISVDEARSILKASMDPAMTDSDKEKVLDSLIRKI